MTAKTNTPKIRFVGFRDDWVQKKLVEEVTFFSGLTYTPNDVVDKSGTLVLRSSNVQNGAITLGDNVYVNSEVVNSQNVEVGDSIVVVRNGSRNLIGKHAMITKPMDNTVIGAFMTGIRAPVPSFFNTLLDTQEFHNEVSKNLGATINQITGGMFKAMSFYLPQSDEQTAIGNLFQNIDQTITLQRRKHEQTQTLKQSLLSKMFPKKGQTQPEIRLAGFSGDWVEVTLRSLVDTVKSYPLSRNFETSDLTTYRYIHYGDIHRSKLKVIDSQNLLPNICIGNYELLRKGDLVVADASEDYEGVANPCVINFNLQDKVVAGLHTIALRPINVDSLYLYYKFSTDSFKNHSRFIATGTKVLGISAKNLLKYESYFPETKEQTAIGQLFKKLDDTISLQAKQLKTLENLKKALLAKMFV